MQSELVRHAWHRANGRCEYCQLPANLYPAPFQIDHIIARQHGGATEGDNLALACIHCNRFKGPNIAGLDRATGKLVRLFHPRKDNWEEHFLWKGSELEGLTDVGRVTIAVLFINDPEVVTLRSTLRDERVI